MPKFYLHVLDGKAVEVSIQANTNHDAINDGLNALHASISRNFPQPENLSIHILNSERTRIATLKFVFEIDYAPGIAA